MARNKDCMTLLNMLAVSSTLALRMLYSTRRAVACWFSQATSRFKYIIGVPTILDSCMLSRISTARLNATASRDAWQAPSTAMYVMRSGGMLAASCFSNISMALSNFLAFS